MMVSVKFVWLFLVLMHGMELKILARTHGMDELLDLDEKTVEQIFINCGIDWDTIKNGIQNSSSFLSINNIIDSIESNPGKIMPSNGNMFDCLVKQRFPLPNLRDEKLKTWLLDYLSKLLNHPSSTRRKLADQHSDQLSPSSSPSPAPSPAISPDSMIIVPVDQPRPPKKKPTHTPPKEKPNSPVPKSKLPAQRSQATSTKNDVENDSNVNVTTIVAVTALLTASVVTLMFFCFYKCRKRNRYYGYRRNSDMPLLSLSLSDFPGSSKSMDAPQSILAPPKLLKTDPLQNAHVTPVPNQLETSPVNNILEKMTTETNNNVPTNISPPPPPTTTTSNNTPTNPSPPPPPSITNVPTNALPPPIMPPPFQKPTPPPPPGPPGPPKAGPPGPPKAGPPPPPPKGVAPPQPPPQGKINISKPNRAPPFGAKKQGAGSNGDDAPKAKLKPFFWDKVQAKPDQSMVWDQLKAGSFQLNDEMIESLFSYNDANKDVKKAVPAKDAAPQYVKILDPRKAQNLAISLKAMNVKSEEVCEALKEGNELPAELLHTLIKMAPTTEEELKIRLFSDPSQLGPAEQFLHGIVEIPFAFERMEALLFMSSLQEESSHVIESFSTIETACKELRNSRLFLKLLEATLKTGNRMNDGTYRGGAQAFKLDTLLKLADVKGVDGKTTLLHFVVLEIIRTEGIRASRTASESRRSISSLNEEDFTDDPNTENTEYFRALGLKVVSGLGDELQNVKKASALDADALTHTAASLGENLLKTKGFLKSKFDGLDEESRFINTLRDFIEGAEADVTRLLEEERRVRQLVRSTTDYFNGDSGKDEGLRLFVVVGQFLNMIDKVCREVKVLKPALKTQKSRETPVVSPARDPRQLLFPAIKDRRNDSSSSSSSSSDEDD